MARTLGAEAACDLYRAFVADTADMLSRLRALAVEWWVDGSPASLDSLLLGRWPVRCQPDVGFGERLAAAFDAAFTDGPGPVAVIGTDCPLLDRQALEALFERLEAGGGAALIPADDGGYVALGLARPCAAAFRGIPWSTAGVTEATVCALGEAGVRTEVLLPLYDVDDLPSLERLARDLAGAPDRAPRTALALGGLPVRPSRVSVRDALGREVVVEPPPGRLVSLVPSVTECLFDTGLGNLLVGRTDYCISPPEAGSLPSVGGPKTVDVELLARLAPDLVLANAEENDRAQVEEIAARGIRVHVAFPRSLPDVAALLRDLGILLRAEADFGRLAAELEAVPAPAGSPRVRCACLIWKAPYLTASGATLTSALIEAAGGENVFAAPTEKRYPAVSLESLATAAPRVVLLPSEPYAFGEADAREIETCVPGAMAVRIPGEWVTWYGSRMAASIHGLTTVLGRFR